MCTCSWVQRVSSYSTVCSNTREIVLIIRIRAQPLVSELPPQLLLPSPRQISEWILRYLADLESRNVSGGNGVREKLPHLRCNVRTLSIPLAAPPGPRHLVHREFGVVAPSTIDTSPSACQRHLIDSQTSWLLVLPPPQAAKQTKRHPGRSARHLQLHVRSYQLPTSFSLVSFELKS